MWAFIFTGITNFRLSQIKIPASKYRPQKKKIKKKIIITALSHKRKRPAGE